MNLQVRNIDRTVEGGYGSNVLSLDSSGTHRVLNVEKVEWKMDEPDIAILSGKDVLNEGEEICVVDYDNSSATVKDVYFVGVVEKKEMHGQIVKYYCGGFEDYMIGKDRTVKSNEINASGTTVSDIINYIFENATPDTETNRFHVNIESVTGVTDKTLTINGIFKLWDLLIKIINAIDFKLAISHKFDYYDSGTGKYYISVNISRIDSEWDSSTSSWITGVAPTDVRSSYYYKVIDNTNPYDGIVSGFKKDTNKIINRFLVATTPSIIENTDTFNSWTDYGDDYHVVMDGNLTYRAYEVINVYWSTDGTTYPNTFEGDEYFLENDGLTLVVVNKPSMVSVKVDYKYKFVYWSKVSDIDSINSYGLKSKKLMIKWTTNLSEAKNYATKLLQYTAKPIVKGLFIFKDWNKDIDVWDEWNLYHDDANAYDVLVKSVELPKKIVRFLSLDEKYRDWNIDVDMRLKRLESEAVGDESEGSLYVPTEQIDINGKIDFGDFTADEKVMVYTVDCTNSDDSECGGTGSTKYYRINATTNNTNWEGSTTATDCSAYDSAVVNVDVSKTNDEVWLYNPSGGGGSVLIPIVRDANDGPVVSGIEYGGGEKIRIYLISGYITNTPGYTFNIYQVNSSGGIVDYSSSQDYSDQITITSTSSSNGYTAMVNNDNTNSIAFTEYFTIYTTYDSSTSTSYIHLESDDGSTDKASESNGDFHTNYLAIKLGADMWDITNAVYWKFTSNPANYSFLSGDYGFVHIKGRCNPYDNNAGTGAIYVAEWVG